VTPEPPSGTDDPPEDRAATDDLIVLVDKGGRTTGAAEKRASHHADTLLHLAFSCYVFDDEGVFLATRRALPKQVWPGVWSNSVCGHPRPGESMIDAIHRRLDEELGMTARDVRVVLPHHIYRAPPLSRHRGARVLPGVRRASDQRARAQSARGWRLHVDRVEGVCPRRGDRHDGHVFVVVQESAALPQAPLADR
jgi:isopentenyl-diphosphate delta-isomerase type 1